MALFFLCAGASLFIHLISSVLTFASSHVLLSNSPWKQERRENREKSSASPEQRRGTNKYTWYDGILSTNEVHVVSTKTYNCYLYLIFLCETMPRMICTKSSCDPTPADTLNRREKQQKELADRLFSVRCWQHRRKKPLFPSTGGTVLANAGAWSWSCKQADKCFCPFTITAGQHRSLLASNLHWHL